MLRVPIVCKREHTGSYTRRSKPCCSYRHLRVHLLDVVGYVVAVRMGKAPNVLSSGSNSSRSNNPYDPGHTLEGFQENPTFPNPTYESASPTLSGNGLKEDSGA